MSTPIYTIADAVEATGIPRQTLVDLAGRHGIGFASVGGTPLFLRRDLSRIKRLRGKHVGRPRKASSGADSE